MMSAFTAPIEHCTEESSQWNKAQKEIKILIGKGKKMNLFLLIEKMIIYIKNSIESTTLNQKKKKFN